MKKIKNDYDKKQSENDLKIGTIITNKQVNNHALSLPLFSNQNNHKGILIIFHKNKYVKLNT